VALELRLILFLCSIGFGGLLLLGFLYDAIREFEICFPVFRYGVSQSDILDSSQRGGELAVRLAVGETQLIQENKAFFASYGVNIGILESSNSTNRAVKRSNTIILVKNLPPNTIKDEVESLFARYFIV
jgi:hypothetical protein